jgi:virulence factor Mce-like protein
MLMRGTGSGRWPGRSRPSRAGTAAIGALVAMAATAIVIGGYAKPDPFSSSLTVRAMFRDASGIGAVGQDVRMAGVPVGKITDRQHAGDHALVTMEIDPSAGPIHSDATAELRPHTAFEGTAYVDLQPGSPTAPPLGDSAIPLTATRSYVPVDEALRTFRAPTRRAIRADLRGFASALAGEGSASITDALARAPRITRQVGDAAAAAAGPHGRELAGAIRGLAATTDAVASQRSDIAPVLRGADRTLVATGVNGGTQLGASVSRLPSTLAALDSGGRALDGVLARVDPLARDISPALRRLPSTLDAATPLVRAAAPVATRATPLIGRLEAALRGVASGAPAGRRVMRSAAPSVRLLGSSLLPALHAPTPELHIPAYLAFLNLFEGGGGASQPYQTATQSSPGGHFMRFGIRFLTGVGAPLPPCSLLGRVNPGLADQAAKGGICTP